MCLYKCVCALVVVGIITFYCMIDLMLDDVGLTTVGKMHTDFETINISELCDVEIVERMRHCNYQKYKTLVRMHLSFELDLNTDEFDLPCHEIAYEDKGKLKKWNRLSKKNKGTVSSTICSATAKSAGNSPTEGLQQQIDAGFMFHLSELKEFLMSEKSLKQEGIFRKTGSVSRQNELRLQIQNEKPLDLEASGYSAHDCATVFKSYLAELTEPLLTDAHYPAHLQIAPLCIGRSFSSGTSTLTRPPNPERIKREQRLLRSMQLLLLLLPDENRRLLEDIIEILHAVANMEHINKMSADNLATLFAPHLICPRNLPPEALHYLAKKLSSIIAYMVTKGDEIFQVPAKLSTDIRAYFLERKRKKTMSPEQTLDESISDMSTVNTVYTFVDRERTAKCNTKNTTDTELAQLYAHIQSLPESSKKRRLIKQFNKQNGQGTPLQLVIMNRLKNSEATRSAKSFGDSIKKHIFHKSIISRTPKRSSAATPVGIETPNFSNSKQPKLRVLFQSPTNSCTASTVKSPELLSGKTSTLPASVTNTSHALNTHPLQKSISSSSLLLNASHTSHIHHHSATKHLNAESDSLSSSSSSSNSNDGLPQQNSVMLGCSVSAPVSRQTSSDLKTVDAMPPKTFTLNASSSSSPSSSSSTSSSQNFQTLEPNCCVTPLKLISEAAKQLITGGGGGGCVEGICGNNIDDKKSVAWIDHQLFEIDENSEHCTTLLQNSSANEFKSRYKSEPNLSRIFKEKHLDIPETVPEQQQTPVLKANAGNTGISLTRKLMKGVSMGNLKFPFSTPESTKRLVRSVSSTLKRRHSDDSQTSSGHRVADMTTTRKTAHIIKLPLLEHDHNSFDDLDDETFEDDPNDQLGSDSDRENDETLESTLDVQTGGNSSSSDIPDIPSGNICNHILVQPTGLYRNIDLITSTPSLLLGRRSMSPITKSAQRMPRSMQESIMTPRSRKPVMVLTTTLGSSDPNQTIYQTDLSSFREQDEDSSSCAEHPNLHNDDAISVGSYTDLMNKATKQAQKKIFGQAEESLHNCDVEDSQNMGNGKSSVLSENFKQYLRTRSVLTDSEPVDSSFSSHPDDFGDDDDTEDDSKQEIVDLNESQLSPSLLYCLDGNEPTELDINSDGISNSMHSETSKETFSTPSTYLTTRSHISRRDIQNPSYPCNNLRKRAATNDVTKLSNNLTAENKAKQSDKANKENQDCNDDFLSSKKLLIGEFPNETSF